jgi:hypothetical protein
MGLKRSSCAARFANGASCSDFSFAGIASAMVLLVVVSVIVWGYWSCRSFRQSMMHVVIGGRTPARPASEAMGSCLSFTYRQP